ncbi:sugar phosphate isomerase/epimerase family protein [Amycolatopsis vancoresmycina]|uniref:Xylose isomerase domain-containing protein n=1 Tax=Amycolatopsis vancoresmycina DSM 44592 TaxID=1292037 RepID=R1I066_9PSEU|nr:TIM barrel protein [Amycolatopsis vancoresmycina]EOD63884.1 xylose isomerase domain-containing protein [Amycolatopsis vancoresmycina DSM 44592]
MPTTPRDRIGLCSVTFRALPAGEVARIAAAAGLHVVEWGADVHAPPRPAPALREVRARTAARGLAVCSYGSYWRAGHDGTEEFDALAEAATVLGAPRIRVWAGTEGSADAAPESRSRVTAALREAAAIAAARGLSVALEFHSGTLADTPAAALRLLDDVGHDALSSYWQPPVDAPSEHALAGLATMLERVSAVHVFSWWPGQHRLPLHERERLWRPALELVAGRPVDVLLEFVPDDDPAVLPREAETLRRWLGA